MSNETRKAAIAAIISPTVIDAAEAGYFLDALTAHMREEWRADIKEAGKLFVGMAERVEALEGKAPNIVGECPRSLSGLHAWASDGMSGVECTCCGAAPPNAPAPAPAVEVPSLGDLFQSYDGISGYAKYIYDRLVVLIAARDERIAELEGWDVRSFVANLSPDSPALSHEDGWVIMLREEAEQLRARSEVRVSEEERQDLVTAWFIEPGRLDAVPSDVIEWTIDRINGKAGDEDASGVRETEAATATGRLDQRGPSVKPSDTPADPSGLEADLRWLERCHPDTCGTDRGARCNLRPECIRHREIAGNIRAALRKARSVSGEQIRAATQAVVKRRRGTAYATVELVSDVIDALGLTITEPRP